MKETEPTARVGLTRMSHLTNQLLKITEVKTKLLLLAKDLELAPSKTIPDLKLEADLAPQTLVTPLETTSLELLLLLLNSNSKMRLLHL